MRNFTMYSNGERDPVRCVESLFGRTAIHAEYHCSPTSPYYDGVVALAVNKGGDVQGVVVHVKMLHEGFTWSAHNEADGPFFDEASKTLLDKLSPPASSEARKWRRRCLENAKDRAAV